MKKLILLLAFIFLSIYSFSKERPQRLEYDGEAIVSNIENVNFNDMSERELIHFMFDNTTPIRSINISPQDTTRKVSNYEKYRMQKDTEDHPIRITDTVVIHDTIYIESENQNSDIYVYNDYNSYSRFYDPFYSTHYYNYYDPWFYGSYPYYSTWYFGYSYYPYNYYPYYYPYYSYPIYSNSYSGGRSTAALGYRYNSHSPYTQTYASGTLSNSRPTRSTSATSQRPSQRNTYNRAIESGERKSYTPTYTNPRMKTRPDFNSSVPSRLQTQSRTATQSRTINSTNKSINQRTQTQQRSYSTTPTRSTTSRSINSSSMNRGSGTVNRSTGSSSVRTGKK